ncbi:hypothetical protein F8388_013334 [Cannabis sativa]|uniref:Uncharacterized protein n=1 Tax=Cannabis sativa TaxID=3483 RepID=A0A7J6FEC7_CANSA|nr:hypothetical protein F8388_013334 [Cannabis sativa]
MKIQFIPSQYNTLKPPACSDSFRTFCRFSPSNDHDEDDAENCSFDEPVELFNKTCHDFLETIWNRVEEPSRTLIHGILQCAVGFHHLFNKVPGYSTLRQNLLLLSPRLANLPKEVKMELEDPHGRSQLRTKILRNVLWVRWTEIEGNTGNKELAKSPMEMEKIKSELLKEVVELSRITAGEAQSSPIGYIKDNQALQGSILNAAENLVFMISKNQYKVGLEGSIPVLVDFLNWLEPTEEIDDLFLGDAEGLQGICIVRRDSKRIGTTDRAIIFKNNLKFIVTLCAKNEKVD